MKVPTYQTTLPPQVRFDHRLAAYARLLYGEIKALCDQQGYCWASNHYFAGLYQVEKKTVSRWISQLETRCYIRVETGKATGHRRRIYLIDDPSKREEVSSQKGIAHPTSMKGHPSKKTRKTPPLLIGNFIDNNDRVDSASTPKGRDISMDRGGVVNAEENDQDSSTSELPDGSTGRRGHGHPPVALAPPSCTQLPSKKDRSTVQFIKPITAEVEAYMLSQKELCPSALTARAQALRFVNYYESNGWKVGRNAMQDWQAAANNWLLNTQTYDTKNSRPHASQRLHSPARRKQSSDNPGSDYYSVPL